MLKRWLRSAAWWILANVHPADTEIDNALKWAYVEAGVSLDNYHDTYVLGAKLHEVLLHASTRIGNPLVTLGDVRELLQ